MKKKFKSWSECVTLREVESLRTLSSHPNVVTLHEVIRESDSGLYFVFEYMPDGNLYEMMKRCALSSSRSENNANATTNLSDGKRGRTDRSPPPLKDGRRRPPPGLCRDRVRSILSQVLSGLSHMHDRGYFHRDVKPENLLIFGSTCKVADFGLAREVLSLPPYTDYVSTRWYRAPEVLLRSPRYGSPIDQFAVGCVMAELLTLTPLFPGRNEVDQVGRIVEVLGRPDDGDDGAGGGGGSWPEGARLARNLRIRLPEVKEEGGAGGAKGVSSGKTPSKGKRGGGNTAGNNNSSGGASVMRRPLEKVVPNLPSDAFELLRDLLLWDPKARPSSAGALRYPYFTNHRQAGNSEGGGQVRAFAPAHQKRRSPSEGGTARGGGRGGVKRKSPVGALPGGGASSSFDQLQSRTNPASQSWGTVGGGGIGSGGIIAAAPPPWRGFGLPQYGALASASTTTIAPVQVSALAPTPAVRSGASAFGAPQFPLAISDAASGANSRWSGGGSKYSGAVDGPVAAAASALAAIGSSSSNRGNTPGLIDNAPPRTSMSTVLSGRNFSTTHPSRV